MLCKVVGYEKGQGCDNMIRKDILFIRALHLCDQMVETGYQTEPCHLQYFNQRLLPVPADMLKDS
ncbi:hypothetical protein SDJN02_15853, partial [Cucurbita argyrosperma subsp. argyrosperma]